MIHLKTNQQSSEDISQQKIVRQNMSFTSWSVQYAIYNMLVKIRHHLTSERLTKTNLDEAV